MRDRRVRKAKPVEKSEKLVGRGGHCGTGVPCGIALGWRSRRNCLGCGCSSVVEHNLAKVGVEGSNPFARSKMPLKCRRLSHSGNEARFHSAFWEALGKQAAGKRRLPVRS